MTDTFNDADLQKNYPPDVRMWSDSDMNPWTNGSVKVVGA